MLYTKADGTGEISTTPQEGFVPIAGTDNMTSADQIGFKAAVLVPGTNNVATPASWIAPGTNQRITAAQAASIPGMLVGSNVEPLGTVNTSGLPADPNPGAPNPAAAPQPAPPPQPGKTGTTQDLPTNESDTRLGGAGDPDSAESLAESGQITQEQANAASMENLEKVVDFQGGSEQDRKTFMESFQKFVLQGYRHGVDTLSKIGSNGNSGKISISYNGAQGYDGMSKDVGGSGGVDFAPGYGKSANVPDWIVFHELGHTVLGLGHSPPTGAEAKSDVMNYYSADNFYSNFPYEGGELFAESVTGDPGKWGNQTPATAPAREMGQGYNVYNSERHSKVSGSTAPTTSTPATGPVPNDPAPVNQPNRAPAPRAPTPTGPNPVGPTLSLTPSRTAFPQLAPLPSIPLIGGSGREVYSGPGMPGRKGGFDPVDMGMVDLESSSAPSQSSPSGLKADRSEDQALPAPPRSDPNADSDPNAFQTELAEILRSQGLPRLSQVGGALSRR